MPTKPNKKSGPWRGPSHLRRAKPAAAPQKAMDRQYKPLTKQRENAVRKEQPFDYFLVVDFECTCEANDRTWPHEIIEFPAVLMEADTGKFVAEFQRYVRPVINPTLTAFCKNLTGIQQNTVDAADTLPVVVREFCEWLAKSVPVGAAVCVATDGPTDLETFMYRMAIKRDKVRFPEVMFTYVDVKLSFCKFFKVSTKPRLKTMLRELGLKFEGREHSGIVDTKNIARLMDAMMDKGCLFGYPLAIRHRAEHVFKGDTSQPFRCITSVVPDDEPIDGPAAEPVERDASGSESDDDADEADAEEFDEESSAAASPTSDSPAVAANADDDDDDAGPSPPQHVSPTSMTSGKQRPAARMIRRNLDREPGQHPREVLRARVNSALASAEEIAAQRALGGGKVAESEASARARKYALMGFVALFSVVNLLAAIWMYAAPDAAGEGTVTVGV